jgi:hypothetical protein
MKQLQAFQKTASAALADVKPDADRQTAAEAEGTDKVTADLQQAARRVIDALTPGDTRDGLLKRWSALDAQIKDSAKITDAAKQAAARKSNEQAAQKLIDDAAAADPKSATAKAAVQDAYKKALTDKYGLTFGAHGKIPEGKNMNYDNVFKTFEKVPIGHAVHNSLKDLSYNPGLVSGGHGIGAFGGASIQLGDFDIDRKADYAGAFRRCALGHHEQSFRQGIRRLGVTKRRLDHRPGCRRRRQARRQDRTGRGRDS